MSKFFLGQRVRVVGAESFPEVIGAETRILAMEQSAYSVTKNVVRHGLIRVDLRIEAYPDQFVCVMPEWIEPILPEGAAPSEFTFHQLMDSLQGAKA